MVERVEVGGLKIAKALYDFANAEALPGTGIAAETFWAAADAIVIEAREGVLSLLPADTAAEVQAATGDDESRPASPPRRRPP